MLEERETIASRLLDRQMDLDEHQLVIKTLETQDGGKKAWRLVGDVLVERRVDVVLPEVKKNAENLKGLVDNLKKQLESKGKEIQEYERTYNIRVKEPGREGQKREGGPGVLVSS